jgi:hypothetical protein
LRMLPQIILKMNFILIIKSFYFIKSIVIFHNQLKHNRFILKIELLC